MDTSFSIRYVRARERYSSTLTSVLHVERELTEADDRARVSGSARSWDSQHVTSLISQYVEATSLFTAAAKGFIDILEERARALHPSPFPHLRRSHRAYRPRR